MSRQFIQDELQNLVGISRATIKQDSFQLLLAKAVALNILRFSDSIGIRNQDIVNLELKACRCVTRAL